MIKINKMTDYGLVLLSQMASSPVETWTARGLSQTTGIPHPTVGKILKILSKSEILVSSRGSLGGYRLSDEPSKIRLTTVIEAFEGRTSLTHCGEQRGQGCEIEQSCPTKRHWKKINQVFWEAINHWTLKDMLVTKSAAKISKTSTNVGR